jgi:hypothetical protein
MQRDHLHLPVLGLPDHSSQGHRQQEYREDNSRLERDYTEPELLSDIINRYWWPVSKVVILGYNSFMSFKALILMDHTYDLYSHLSPMMVFCISVAILAVVDSQFMVGRNVRSND